MKTKNYKFTSLFLVLFFGIIGLTSCEKEEEIKKTELGEAVSEVKPDKKEYIVNDSTSIEITDYQGEIVTSNWIEIQTEGGNDIDFFDNNFGIVGDWETISVTYDGGNNWENKSMSVEHPYFHKVQVSNINTFYVTDAVNIYSSIDGGANYTQVNDVDSLIGSINDFYFLDSLNYIVSHGNFSHYKVESTSDGGQTWKNIVDIKKINAFLLYYIQFVDNNVGYIASNEVYKTTDKGRNWQLLSTPKESDERVSSIYFINKDIGYITANKYIYKTEDGGENWSTVYQIPTNYWVQDMIFVDEQLGYINLKDGIILRTTNGGINWIVDYYSGRIRPHTTSDYQYYSLTKKPNNTIFVTGTTTMKRKRP